MKIRSFLWFLIQPWLEIAGAIPMAPMAGPGQLRNHAMVVLGTAHPGKSGADFSSKNGIVTESQPGYQWISMDMKSIEIGLVTING